MGEVSPMGQKWYLSDNETGGGISQGPIQSWDGSGLLPCRLKESSGGSDVLAEAGRSVLVAGGVNKWFGLPFPQSIQAFRLCWLDLAKPWKELAYLQQHWKTALWSCAQSTSSEYCSHANWSVVFSVFSPERAKFSLPTCLIFKCVELK